MKKITALAGLLLWIGFINLTAQINRPSFTKFNYTDLLDYTSNCRADLQKIINNAILEGKLNAYNDIELTQALTVNDYFNKIAIKENLTIPNPDNPDDIYDLIDTLVVSYSQASIFTFIDNTVVKCENQEDSTFYISFIKLSEFLDKRLTSTINYFLNSSFKTISDLKLDPFCFEVTSKLCKKLYNYGIGGEVKMYVFDSLKRTFSLQEITDRTSTKINEQHQNPANPNDKYDLIDTVITTYFNPDSIKTIFVYYSWDTQNFISKAKFYALAPTFKPVVAGLELPLTSIFLIKASDYLKTLNENEKAFWQHFYTFLLQKSSSNGKFNYR